jgi:hypothetical protein
MSGSVGDSDASIKVVSIPRPKTANLPSRVKKNRIFEGGPVRTYRQHPYWHAVGRLSGGLKVHVVRHRRKYYVTNRLSLTAVEIRTLYKRRHEVEEVFKMLKSQLSLEACQAGYSRSLRKPCQAREGTQEHHIALCLAAYLILERERLDQGLSLRQLRRKLIVKGLQAPLPSLQRLKIAA